METKRYFSIWNYHECRINLYRMFFADCSVNFQQILMKFCKDYFRVMRRLPLNFYQKILYSLIVRLFDVVNLYLRRLSINPSSWLNQSLFLALNCITCKMVYFFSHTKFSDENFTAVAAWREKSPCKISWKSVGNWLRNRRKIGRYKLIWRQV